MASPRVGGGGSATETKKLIERKAAGPRRVFSNQKAVIEAREITSPAFGDFLREAFKADGRTYSGSGELGLLRLVPRVDGEYGVTSPYNENAYVRAGIKALTQGLLRMPLQLWSGPPSDKAAKEVRKDHPLLGLLAKPHPRITGSENWRAVVSGLKLDGGSYLFCFRGGEPLESDPLTGAWKAEPDQVVAIRQRWVQRFDDSLSGWPSEYTWNAPQGSHQGASPTKRFSWGSVIPILDHDPDSLVEGAGDVDVAAAAIEVQREVEAYNYAALRNGGDLGGVVTYKQDFPAAELARHQRALSERAFGADSDRVLALGGDASFTYNPHSPKDMEFGSSYDRATEAILVAIGSPPPVIGLYGEATMNNVETAYRQMWVGPNGILALAALIENAIRERLFVRAGKVWKDLAALYPRFNSSQIEELEKDRTPQITAAVEAAAKGNGISQNEALELYGIEAEPLPEGDRHLVKSGYTDLDTGETFGAPAPTAQDEQEEEEPEEPSTDTKQSEASERTYSDSLQDSIVVLQGKLTKTLKGIEREVIANLRRLADGGDPVIRQIEKADTNFRLDEPINVDGLTDIDLDLLLVDNAPWILAFDLDTRRILADVFLNSARATYASIASGGPVIGGPLTASSQRSVSFLSSHQPRVVEGVASRLSKGIKDTIAKRLSSAGIGETGTLRDAIKAQIEELADDIATLVRPETRAATIAETEVNIADRGGQFEQSIESGVEEIEWDTADDEHVRETHKKNNGLRRVLGDRFPNGLRYPLDPEGSASEVILCRCNYSPTRIRRPE